MKPLNVILFSLIFFTFACSTSKTGEQTSAIEAEKSLVAHVELTDPLDTEMIQEGTRIFSSKCAKCHTLDTAVFMVPSFAGVTNRRSPEWIMNMILNVDEMLKKDPVAGDLLKKHKMEMPDPNLSVAEARSVLEFLRNNDLEQIGSKDGLTGE